MFFIILLSILAALVLATVLVLMLYPAFGGKITAENRQAYNSLSYYDGKKFKYELPTSVMGMNAKEMLSLLREFLRGNPERKPGRPLPMKRLSRENLAQSKEDRVIWFGHSALLLQLSGKTLLIDPMFGKAPSPFPLFGGNRYSGKLPMELDDLPWVDVMLLSHDHYDHLDYGTIRKLRSRVGEFIVPLGVGPHLIRWGVEKHRIKEMGWWEELELEGLSIVSTPARHFSGRGPSNRDSTLWCSWVIQSPRRNLFFSGDSGYGPHFKKIGERYGPFDLSFVECGQYNEKWADIHMLPEETVQASLDVRSKRLIPIHWGAFTLALHAWHDPAERALREAGRLGADIILPQIGESVYLDADEQPGEAWWRNESR
nr:MBL fold metallo-hydrolase [Paenibacillus sp. HB172176]